MNRGIQPGIEGRLCGLCKANTIIGAYGTAPAAFDLEEAKLTPTHPISVLGILRTRLEICIIMLPERFEKYYVIGRCPSIGTTVERQLRRCRCSFSTRLIGTPFTAPIISNSAFQPPLARFKPIWCYTSSHRLVSRNTRLTVLIFLFSFYYYTLLRGALLFSSLI